MGKTTYDINPRPTLIKPTCPHIITTISTITQTNLNIGYTVEANGLLGDGGVVVRICC